MRHRKMQQTIAAMVTILGEMRSKDYLTIITFATNITVWELGESAIVKASPNNIEAAVKHIKLLEAAGSTNINEAVLKALTIGLLFLMVAKLFTQMNHCAAILMELSSGAMRQYLSSRSAEHYAYSCIGI